MNEGVPTYILRQTGVRKVDPMMQEQGQTLGDSARQNQCLRHGEQRHPKGECQIVRELRCHARRRVDAEHCQREKHQAGSVDWSAQADISQQQASYR